MLRKNMLTDEQIATQYFVVPYILMGWAFDSKFCQAFDVNRRAIREAGGELLMIGWPDGTTMTYECLKRGDPIDIECISEIYKATACMKEVMS